MECSEKKMCLLWDPEHILHDALQFIWAELILKKREKKRLISSAIMEIKGLVL